MTNEKESTEETTVVATEATTVETTVEPPRGTTETTYRCNNCGATVVPAQVETPTGPRNQCPSCGKLMKLIKNKAPPSPLEKEKQETLWKEDVEPTEVLRSILENHPDVTSSQVGEIMDWAKYGLIEPYVLTQLLASMRGMTDRRAALIGYKYGLALNKIQGKSHLSFPNFVMGLQQQGGGSLPFLSMPQSWNRQSSPQGGPQGGDGGMSEGRVLKLLDDRERKVEEKKKENTLMQTLSGIQQAFDNLNERISSIEQSGPTAKTVEKVKNPLQEQIDVALGKRFSSVILGEDPSLEKLKIIARELKGSAPTPAPGSRNQYDMEVEKATHEAAARKVEAEEKRKGYEAVGGGIRDGLQGLGFNMGAGLSAGPAGITPTPTQPKTMAPSEPQLPIRGADGQLYVECPHCHTSPMIPEGQARVVCPSCSGIVNIMTREEATRTNEVRGVEMPAAEPQPMDWRDGYWHTRCAYSDCRSPIVFEDGKSTVACPACHRVIQVQPTEEELKQKVSTGKRTETKAETKEKESSEAEGPKGAEEPDVKIVEKVEGVAT